jgi:hypothetical protein
LWLDGNKLEGTLSGLDALDELPMLQTVRVEGNRLEGEISLGALRMLLLKVLSTIHYTHYTLYTILY